MGSRLSRQAEDSLPNDVSQDLSGPTHNRISGRIDEVSGYPVAQHRVSAGYQTHKISDPLFKLGTPRLCYGRVLSERGLAQNVSQHHVPPDPVSGLDLSHLLPDERTR